MTLSLGPTHPGQWLVVQTRMGAGSPGSPAAGPAGAVPGGPRTPLSAPRGAGPGRVWAAPSRCREPACSALTQRKEQAAAPLPAAFPCERCLIISDRVQRRHLFASGESPFRLSITVTGSTFLEALFPFIMGLGWGGGVVAGHRHEAQTKTLLGPRAGRCVAPGHHRRCRTGPGPGRGCQDGGRQDGQVGKGLSAGL